MTRVIETTVRELEASGARVVVLTGEPSSSAFLESRSAVIEGLGYRDDFSEEAIQALEKELVSAAKKRLGAAPDVWHAHNPSLAKNVVLTACVSRLARRGEAVLLQIHDFPEDGRPGNYQILKEALRDYASRMGSVLYPISERVAYATLNSRDCAILQRSGIPSESTFILANPIAETSVESGEDALSILGVERLLLYPSRSIRRKNIGEAILCALRMPPGAWVGLTLAPENPKARPVYDRWKKLAGRWNTPILFELGSREDVTYEALLGAAYAFLTTSVGEGFGLAFLEPWMIGKGVVGRDLPEITRDFRRQSLKLDGLYDRLPIPVDWVGPNEVEALMTDTLERMYRAYGKELSPRMAQRALDHLVVGGRTDFGCLDEATQIGVLERIVNDPGLINALDLSILDTEFEKETMERNAEILRRLYNGPAYADRLLSIYKRLAESPVSVYDYGDSEKVLSEFLDPVRARPLLS